MILEAKIENIDCIKNAVAIINNKIYKEKYVSEYNRLLLNALLGENWQEKFSIGDTYFKL